jgi:hypothetical protein
MQALELASENATELIIPPFFLPNYLWISVKIWNAEDVDGASIDHGANPLVLIRAPAQTLVGTLLGLVPYLNLLCESGYKSRPRTEI